MSKKVKENSSLKYWVWLSSLSGVSTFVAGEYLKHFKTPENVFLASDNELRNIAGFDSRGNVIPIRQNIHDAEKVIETCALKNYQIITLDDKNYPDRLKNIYDPPIAFYVNGKLPDIDNEPIVAIIGTRQCTPYGYKAAEKIACGLSEKGITVITGLALGIDTAASLGALKGGTHSLGVIGSGLDVIYPSENKKLFDDLSHRGAIISEYAPGFQPRAWSFPARNRIVSGLSLGVLIIEAPKKSGALITAERAVEQGRDVFVLPGNIDMKTCEGSNLLLRDGAIPVLSAEDIINEYKELFSDKIHTKVKTRTTPRNNVKTIDNTPYMQYIDLNVLLGTLYGDEKLVANTIGNDIVHVDDIIKKSKLSTHQVLTALTMLEVNGYAVSDGSKFFRLQQTQAQ